MHNKSVQERSADKAISPLRSKTIDKENRSKSTIKKRRKVIEEVLHSEYKPYTIRDYKNTILGKKIKLGGLGANKDDLWEQAMTNLQRMKYFGFEIRK